MAILYWYVMFYDHLYLYFLIGYNYIYFYITVFVSNWV